MTALAQDLNMTLSPVQSVTRLSFPVLMKSSGINYFDFIRITDSFDILRNDRPIPYRRLASLLNNAARLTECEHLGILLGQSGATDTFGPLYSDALKARTVREALTRLAAEFRSKDCGAVLELTAGKSACLRYILVDPAIDTGSTISDLAMAIAMRMLIELCGPGWTADLVELSRRKPGDVRPYRQHFRCPIAFDSTVAAIHFNGKWLDQPLAARRMSDDTDDDAAQPAPSDPAMPERVILQLSRSISNGSEVSASKVARHFGICDRTLQRELTKAHTSYRSLSAEVHFGVAKRLLHDTDMPVTDIALSLGYADASVLTRAFTRWAGTCPSDWRSRKQQRPAMPNDAESNVVDFTVDYSPTLQRRTA